MACSRTRSYAHLRGAGSSRACEPHRVRRCLIMMLGQSAAAAARGTWVTVGYLCSLQCRPRESRGPAQVFNHLRRPANCQVTHTDAHTHTHTNTNSHTAIQPLPSPRGPHQHGAVIGVGAAPTFLASLAVMNLQPHTNSEHVPPLDACTRCDWLSGV
jgi:hypothetical protein